MRKIFLIFGLLVVAYLLLAIMASPTIKLERKISIAAPPEILAPMLLNQKIFHETWSPWAIKDTAMQVKYYGTPGVPGHKLEWVSEESGVGTGTLELVRLNGDSIVEKLTFEGMGGSPYFFVAKNTGKSTELLMGITLHPPFLLRPLMMMGDAEKEIGNDFEVGLVKLKRRAELASNNLNQFYKVNELQWPETYFSGTPFDTLETSRIGGFFAKSLPEIGKKMITQKIKPMASPMAIYKWFDHEHGLTEIAAVSMVEKGVKLKGFKNHQYPAGKVLKVAYYGKYDNLGLAHASIDKYMSEHGMKYNVVIEEYVTGPNTEADTARWLTNVFYLLK